MENNRFFRWVTRINSLLFLAILILSLIFALGFFQERGRWKSRNTVEAVNQSKDEKKLDNFRLGGINEICGTDIQYVKLTSPNKKNGSYSSGYGSQIRNVIFLMGENSKTRWLLDTNSNLIQVMDAFETKGAACKNKKSAPIYYQLIKSDTNTDGFLDDSDKVTIALSMTDGSNYREIATEIDSIIDHKINSEGTELMVLYQKSHSVVMAKFSSENYQLISETEISRISRKL